MKQIVHFVLYSYWFRSDVGKWASFAAVFSARLYFAFICLKSRLGDNAIIVSILFGVIAYRQKLVRINVCMMGEFMVSYAPFSI